MTLLSASHGRYAGVQLQGLRLAAVAHRAETQALLAQTQEAAARNGRESEAPKEPTEQMRTVARNRVHASVLLEELSIRNQIRPTQQRVSECSRQLLDPEEPQKVIEMYLRDQQLMAGLRSMRWNRVVHLSVRTCQGCATSS